MVGKISKVFAAKDEEKKPMLSKPIVPMVESITFEQVEQMSDAEILDTCVCSFDPDGLLHSDSGNPAYMDIAGYCEWYDHGILHRDRKQGPAIIAGNAYMAYYENGSLIKETQQRKPVALMHKRDRLLEIYKRNRAEEKLVRVVIGGARTTKLEI